MIAALFAALPVAGAPALPLEPARSAAFTTSEATWASVDVAPGGTRLVFDLLGDLYELPLRGGRAAPLRTGVAFESQPVYSPDGRRIAFISDADGNENLWVADADGRNARRLSALDDNTEMMSPAWSPDGRRVYVSQVRPEVGAAAIWAYGFDGEGEQVVEHGAAPGTPRDRRMSAVGAAPSPDGRWLYYATRPGHYRRDGAPWSIVRRELATGRTETVVAPPGGAARPVLSRDGALLAYASRRDGETGLRLRDLETGADREVAWPIQAEQRITWVTMDVVPRFAFTPDARSLVYTHGARLHRVDLATGRSREIPFEAAVDKALGRSLRREIPIEEGPVRARLVQHAAEAPDGDRIVFSALTRLFVMELHDGAAPRPLLADDVPAFHPAWSADGASVAFVSWSAAEGGHVWRVGADGRAPRRVTRDAAFYTGPAFTADGRYVYALRSSHHDRMHQAMEYGAFRQADLVRIALRDGTVTVLASGRFGGPPQPLRDGRVWVWSDDGLVSFAAEGGDRRIHARVTGPQYYFEEGRQPVFRVRVSPDARHALAQFRSRVYLLELPELDDGDRVPAVDVADAERLSPVGGDFIGWSADGTHVHWTVGSTHHRRLREGGEVRAFDAVVELPRDVPEGTLVLRGGTAVTMRGDEVIADADVVVSGNRIVAVGPRGTVRIPAGAAVRDVAGHWVLPGFIDTHAHWADIRREVLERQPYSVLANLAFGVTAGLDVSTLTVDMLAYEDMLEAGIAVGLRAFSTGPGVFSFNEFTSRGQVVDVLTRYRDHYRVTNVKQYRVGNRLQRQWFADVAAELGLVPTTEGADNFKLSVTQVLDGFAGVEHALPVAGLGTDVVELLVRSGTSNTPTLAISDSRAGLGRFILEGAPHEDPRVRRFIPPPVVDAKTARVEVLRDDGYLYRRQARDVARLARAGARIGVGSHSEFHGIGFHWELQALAAGGLTPHEVLRLATAGSADVIGRGRSLGALDTGMLADLVVLSRDPLEDVRNTLNVALVMKNGRLYDAATLDELWPRQRALPPLWFWTE